ncbi:deoxyribonuclease [Paenibacillus sp. 5J-6]|uniref:Deoxyribonuclease n=1 Tax=Paenibacillus silvestris TaxID=2606219 RepID=A0A6L8USK5_9BACL|nr:DNA/RNA non-specific endonuclease [Paenibacillus silvestris]MZQ81078.1 deoxyribonuclease [Paenibacillus silvestris]
MKKLSNIFVTALALSLIGCSAPTQKAAVTKNSTTTQPISSSSSTQSASSASSSTSSESEILAKLMTYTNAQSPGPTKDYYWENGAARLSGFDAMKAGDYHFTSDSQGRSATARAVLTYAEFKASKGERQGTPLDPPAWPAHNPKVAIGYSLTGKTYHGYLYNRSHSIADSLLGKGSYTSPYNFTTGTRSQNVGADQNGGMRATEEKVERFWSSHVNTSVTIEYETTPLYSGNETIPRGSIVDVKSSDGSLNFEIIVINDAEGHTINYNNGADTSISQ